MAITPDIFFFGWAGQQR